MRRPNKQPIRGNNHNNKATTGHAPNPVGILRMFSLLVRWRNSDHRDSETASYYGTVGASVHTMRP
jgi:hypothetical protein